MDRQSVIGLILIGLVILSYGYFTQPSPEQKAEAQRLQDSIQQASAQLETTRNAGLEPATQQQSQTAPPSAASFEEPDSLELVRSERAARSAFGPFYPSASGQDGTYVIENEKLEATISAKGGYIQKLRLKEFKAYDKENSTEEETIYKELYLFDERSDMSIRLKNRGGDFVQTKDLYFEPVGDLISVSGENESEFRMRLRTDDTSKYVDFVYTLKGADYELGFDVDVVGLGSEIDLSYGMLLDWSMAGLSNEKSREYEKTIASVFYRQMGEDRDFLSESESEEMELVGRTNWIAFKQTFFSAVAMSKEGFPADEGWIAIETMPEAEDTEDNPIVKNYKAQLTLPMAEAGGSKAGFTFYFGPNDYTILKEYDNEMDRIINLGWGIFGWMNKWLVIPIFNFLENRIASYGIIILILTIIIKMILFPLTYKNYLSSAKMKVLKPEVDELNEKFKDEEDPMKKQQAQMALYKRTGVNPMAGCVPMVIQMPILYAMFRFFPASIELRQESFLWAEDLSSYDSIAQLPFEIPFYGDHVSLFTLLMAVSTLLYTRMNSSQMPAAQPGMPNMKNIMMFFPIMMLFFFNSFAAGLSYYYLAANVISMAQMYLIKEVIIDDKKIRAQIEENKKKPVKKSAFQKRLEEAAKQRGAAQSSTKKKKKKK